MPERVESQEMEVQRHGMMFLISNIGLTVGGFFSTMFFAHWVGPEILGIYFLFLSYYAMVSLFSDSGIGYAGKKRLSEGSEPDAFYTACLALRIVLYAIIVVVMLVFQDRFVDLNQAGLFWSLIALVGLGIINAQFSTSIIGSNRLGLAASTSLVSTLSRIGMQVILVICGFGIFGLMGGLIAGILIEIGILFRFVGHHLRRFSWDHVRNIFTFSVWAFLTSSGTTVFEYINFLVIGYMMAITDVGIYGIAWNFSSCAIFVTLALCNTLFVKVSRWSATGDTDAISTSLSRACTYSLIFSIPILFGGIFLSGPLLYYLYGAGFSGGALPLLLLIGMRAIQSIQQIYFTYLMALGHARNAFYVTGGMATMNLLLDLFFVPVFGIAGAAMVSLLTMGISTVFAHHQLARRTRIGYDRATLRNIFLGVTAMSAALLVLTRFVPISSALHLAGMVGIGTAIYFGLLLAADSSIRESFLRMSEIRWNP